MKAIKPLLLSIVFLLALPAIAWADEHGSFSNTEWEGVSAYLSRMSDSAELFGFDQVDLSSLEVSDAIATYEYHDEALQRGADVWLVYENDEPSFAFWGPFDGQYTNAELYFDALVKGLEEFDGAPLAIVCDKSGIGVTDGRELVHVVDLSEDVAAALDKLSDNPITMPAWSELELTEADVTMPMNYKYSANTRSTTVGYGYLYCQTGQPTQTLSNTCWAACCVTLLSYRGYVPSLAYDETFNDAWLAHKVANYQNDPNNYNVGRDAYEIRDILNYCLGRSTAADHAYQVYGACPIYNAFLTYTLADSPVIGRTRPYDIASGVYGSFSHAILITGVQLSGTCICAWVPDHVNGTKPRELFYDSSSGHYYFPVLGTSFNQYRLMETVYEQL